MEPDDEANRTARPRFRPLTLARGWWMRQCRREDLAGAANRRTMGSPRPRQETRRRWQLLEDPAYVDAMVSQLEEIRNLPEVAH